MSELSKNNTNVETDETSLDPFGDKAIKENLKRANLQIDKENAVSIRNSKHEVLQIPEVQTESKTRLFSATFRENKDFMNEALTIFTARKQALPLNKYKLYPERIPINFLSNQHALRHLDLTADQYVVEKTLLENQPYKRSLLTIKDAVEIFIKSKLAATVMQFDGADHASLITYDYDLKLYTASEQTVNQWIVKILGKSSAQDLKTFIMTLEARASDLAIFNPLPNWVVAVKNGLFNCLTNTLEPMSPLYTVLNRVDTCFIENAVEPKMDENISFNRLVYDLANGNPARIELILQMCKAIVTGFLPSNAFFMLIGSGGDGKSVFMELLHNIVGNHNVGFLSFEDMNDESKVVNVVSRRLITGMDNSANTRITNTGFLKSAASQEVVTLFRKYLPAMSIRFKGIVVELCNAVPSFAETGSAMKRRGVSISCENSHYEKNDEITNLRVMIGSQLWHEYILWYLLTQVDYYSDFNDVDRHLLNDALDESDSIQVFFNELAELNVFNDNCKIIPRSLLYAMYADWLQVNYPASRVHSARTFSARTNSILADYGYVPGDHNIWLGTLENNLKLEYRHVFSQYMGGPNVEDVFANPKRTRYLVREKDIVNERVKRDGRRYPKPVSAAQYFRVFVQMEDDIVANTDDYLPLLEKYKIKDKMKCDKSVVSMSFADIDKMVKADNEKRIVEKQKPSKPVKLDLSSIDRSEFFALSDGQILYSVVDGMKFDGEFLDRVLSVNVNMRKVMSNRVYHEQFLIWFNVCEGSVREMGNLSRVISFNALVDQLLFQVRNFLLSVSHRDAAGLVDMAADDNIEDKILLIKSLIKDNFTGESL